MENQTNIETAEIKKNMPPVPYNSSVHSPENPQNYFIIEFGKEEYDTFIKLMHRMGIKKLVSSNTPDLISKMNNIDPKMLKIVTIISSAVKTFSDTEPNFTFRYVSVNQFKNFSIDTVATNAIRDGGKAPTDKDVGTWVDNSGKVEESIKNAKHNFVLFIYDDNKLKKLDGNDICLLQEGIKKGIEDPYAHIWRKKPIDGLNLKDCVVGVIKFNLLGDNSPQLATTIQIE